MEQPVITVCNYVDVIGSYCYTYVTGRVCYTATCTLKYNLDTLYFKCLEEVLVRPAGGTHPAVCVGPNAPV